MIQGGERMSKKADIKSFVGKKISMFQAEAGKGDGKAMLANLRRGVGHEPGELPQLFGVILLDMPEEFMSGSGIATKEEWACYIALTLYALHQQGHSLESQPMHTKENISIGRALSRLARALNDPNAEQRMLQRLQKLATAVDMKELSYHLRGVIQLLKSNGIPINYQDFAADLYELQMPEGKKQVCFRWGQDFYREKNKKKEEEDV